MAHRKPRTKRTADNDAVMELVAQEMLLDPSTCPKPEMRRAMLERFLDLLEQEKARLPAHRPATNPLGSLVAVLVSTGMEETQARRRVAKIRGATITTVSQAHRRYLKSRQQ
jgi:hypothetical protein